MILLIGLALQIAWHPYPSNRVAQVKSLPAPPAPTLIQLVSLNDSITAGKLIMLWLQAFDTQPGISIPLAQLDYDQLINWLDVIVTLDSRSHYPLLAASRLYTYVPDSKKKRQMLDFIHHKFLEAPEERWIWMAHAVLLAKHQLNDSDYAFELANSLREHTPQHHAPNWIRQMDTLILKE